MNDVAVLSPGVVTADCLLEVPESVYHADPALLPSLSSSIAKKILPPRTPAHAWYRHPRLNPSAPPDMDLAKKTAVGAACHELLLGKGGGIHIVQAKHKDTGRVVSNYLTKAAQEERDTAIRSGLTPLLSLEYEAAERIVEQVQKQIPWLGMRGRAEISGYCQENGQWRRAMFDLLDEHNMRIYDLKFTECSADAESWGRQIERMGYHIQHGHYTKVLSKIAKCRQDDVDFVFVVVELGPPLLVAVHRVDMIYADIGMHDAARAFEIWSMCMQANHWPGYPCEIQVAECPSWLSNRYVSITGAPA